MWIEIEKIKAMAKNPRANFVNALAGPRSAYLVGTQDHKAQTNLSMVSSCIHFGSDPALLGILIRPRAVPRDTLENILETRFWTFNNVTESICEKAHQTSARYPKEISEFSATGLTPAYHESFVAPYVEESSLNIGMELVQHLPISANNTELLIGKVCWVKLRNEKAVNLDEGLLDLEALGSLSVVGLDYYHQVEKLFRLSYAKTDRLPQKI